jgi:hypothetical protein
MYDTLFETLLEKRKLTIKVNVTISSLRKGMVRETQSYIRDCELLDQEVPDYHVSIKPLGDNRFELELHDTKPEGNPLFAPKFSFEIEEDEDEKIRGDMDEA